MSDVDTPDLPDFRQFLVVVRDGNHDEVPKTVFAHTVNTVAGMTLPTVIFSSVIGYSGGMAVTQISRILASVVDVQDLGIVDGSGIVQ